MHSCNSDSNQPPTGGKKKHTWHRHQAGPLPEAPHVAGPQGPGTGDSLVLQSQALPTYLQVKYFKNRSVVGL